MGKLPITLVMCVYNEEKIIEEALKSAIDYVSEIIVVHDGPCSDNTGKIVKKYGGKFFETEVNTGGPEFIRIKSYELATQKYILQLDADESLTNELQAILADIVESNVDFATVIWSHYRHSKKVRTLVRRSFLFKKDSFYYIECMHESPRPKQGTATKHYNVDLFNDADDRYKDQKKVDENQLKKQAKWIPIHARALIKYDTLKRFQADKKDKGSLFNELLSSRWYLFHGYITIPMIFTASTLVTAVKFRQNPFFLFADITVHNTRYYRDLVKEIRGLRND